MDSDYTNIDSGYTNMDSGYTNMDSDYTNMNSDYTNMDVASEATQSRMQAKFGAVNLWPKTTTGIYETSVRFFVLEKTSQVRGDSVYNKFTCTMKTILQSSVFGYSGINLQIALTCWAHKGDVMCFLWGTVCTYRVVF
jgi:hypothetical protein